LGFLVDPYVPLPVGILGLKTTQASGGYTAEQMARIQAQNALGIFPAVAKKLGVLAV
jgi:hypothetical protein